MLSQWNEINLIILAKYFRVVVKRGPFLSLAKITSSMKYDAIIFALFCFMLSGCYSYKAPPDITDGDQYTAKTRADQRCLPIDDKILNLENSISIALANNPNYTSTKHSMAAAYARFYQSLSVFFPTISGNFNANQYQYVPMNQGGLGGNTKWRPTYGATLAGQWVVFNGLMDTMNMLAARYSAKQTESLNRDSRRLLIQSIIVTYNQVLLNRAQMRIAEADEMFEQQMVDDTQLKYDAGAASLSDLLNFKILKNNATDNVITSRLNFDTFRFMLAELMGLTTGEIPDDVQFPELDIGKDMEFSLGVEFYLDLALSQRPDLQSFRESLEANKYLLYSSWGSFLPNVILNMNYGYSRTDQQENYPVGSARPRSLDLLYNYGMNVNWLLFDGGSRWAQVRQSQANVAFSEEQLADKWITVVTEVRQAHAKLVSNIAEAKILGDTLDMTKKQRDLVREEYNAGNTSITRLNEAQRDLILAQLNHISALIDIENAKAQIDAACGSR